MTTVSLDEFNVVLKPKLQGTYYLDRVTKTQPLDFFVVFSSISSELGDYGPGAYAAGNRFPG